MFTVIEALGLTQPFTVTNTLYTPAFEIVALDIEGFCNEEENPLGPDQ
jgi:hypothetical protein